MLRNKISFIVFSVTSSLKNDLFYFPMCGTKQMVALFLRSNVISFALYYNCPFGSIKSLELNIHIASCTQ